MRRVGLTLSFLIVTVGMYLLITQLAVESVVDHPYENILKQKRDLPFRASTVTGILRDAQLRSSIGLSDEQLTRIESIYAEYDEASQKFYERWKKENGDAGYYIPFSAEGESAFVIEKAEEGISILSDDQRKRLTQIEYRLAGWDFVFLDNVSRQLGMSDSQLKELMDLQVEFIRERNALFRELKSDPVLLEKELNVLKRVFETRFRTVFSEAQIQKRERLVGTHD